MAFWTCPFVRWVDSSLYLKKNGVIKGLPLCDSSFLGGPQKKENAQGKKHKISM